MKFFIKVFILGLIYSYFLSYTDKVFAGSLIVVNDPINQIAQNNLCSLSEAIINANTNSQNGSVDCASGSSFDVIRLNTDVFTPNFYQNGLIEIFATPLITESVVFDGAGYKISKSIGGGFGFFASRHSPDVDLIFKNLKFENGDSGSGNAIHALNINSIQIRDSFFINNNEMNLYGEGGSVYAYNVDKIEIIDSDFLGGSASSGGALFAVNSKVLVKKSIFKNHTSPLSSGSVFSFYASDVLIEDSSFEENNGSVIYTHGGSGQNVISKIKVLNSTFSQNQNLDQNSSSVIKNSASTLLTILNSTFSGNTSNGAMISAYEGDDLSDISIFYSTFYANTADAGIFRLVYSVLNLKLENNIFTQNIGYLCESDINSSISYLNNLTDDTSCGGQINPVTGFSNILLNNGGKTKTHRLLPGSNAIDSSIHTTNMPCPKKDQRGFNRNIDGNGDGAPSCDIGAYEFEKRLINSVSRR